MRWNESTVHWLPLDRQIFSLCDLGWQLLVGVITIQQLVGNSYDRKASLNRSRCKLFLQWIEVRSCKSFLGLINDGKNLLGITKIKNVRGKSQARRNLWLTSTITIVIREAAEGRFAFWMALTSVQAPLCGSVATYVAMWQKLSVLCLPITIVARVRNRSNHICSCLPKIFYRILLIGTSAPP